MLGHIDLFIPSHLIRSAPAHRALCPSCGKVVATIRKVSECNALYCTYCSVICVGPQGLTFVTAATGISGCTACTATTCAGMTTACARTGTAAA